MSQFLTIMFEKTYLFPVRNSQMLQSLDMLYQGMLYTDFDLQKQNNQKQGYIIFVILHH